MTNVGALYNKGLVLKQLGRNDDAQEYFERSSLIDPDYDGSFIKVPAEDLEVPDEEGEFVPDEEGEFAERPEDEDEPLEVPELVTPPAAP